MTRRLKRLGAWKWALPALLVLGVVTLWPLGRAVQTSLYRSNATTPDDRRFVGIDNYTSVLTDQRWWAAVSVSILLVVVVVTVQLALGFAFAGALRQVSLAWPVARILVLLPAGVLAVVSAVAWRSAVTDGFVRTWFRIDDVGALDALAAVAAAEIWRGTGIVTVILYVGLMRVDEAARESAVADGATPRQRLRLVLWPAVAPAFAVAVTYRFLDTLRVVEGPLLADDATVRFQTAPVLLWDAAFTTFETGLAAATSVLLLLITAFIGVGLVLLLRVRRVV